MTSTTPSPAGASPRRIVDQPGRDVVLGQRLDQPLGGAVAGEDHDHAVAVLAPRLDVGDGALDVAAVGGRPGGPRRSRTSLVSDRRAPNGLTVHHGRAACQGVLAHVAELAVRRRAEVDRRLARRRRPRPSWRRGTPGWSRPGRGRGCGPARGRRPARGCRRASRRPAAPARRRAPGRATPCPRRRCRRRACRSARAAAGGPRPSAAARRRTSVGQQQLAARRRPQPAPAPPGCAGRRRRSCGSPRRRRPRTPPGPGAPRSAGRRRRCRRGPRTRRASRPGRPGCTPRRRGRGRPPRGRGRRPTASSTGSRSPRPGTCGWSTERTGATTTESGPLAAASPGWREPAQHGQPAADGVAAGAEPLVRQRLPARVVGDRRRGRRRRRARRPGPRPRATSP